MSSEIDWFRAAHDEFNKFFDLEQSIPEEEAFARSKRVIDSFHYLFLSLMGELRIQDTWGEGHCYLAPFGTGIIEKSGKWEFEITLGINLDTWFIEVPIKDPYFLRYMKDNYWAHIVKLTKLGKAELHDYGRPSDWASTEERRTLVRSNCSLVYSMARDYTLMAASGDNCFSLGGINVSIPLKTKQQDVRAFYKAALESLYKSNQLLGSASSSHYRRISKRFSQQSDSQKFET